MRNKIFSLILVVLFCFGIFMFVKQQKEESSLEKRELLTREDLKFDTLFNGTFTNEIDTLFKDQFTGRDHLVQAYYKLKIMLNKTLGNSNEEGSIHYLDKNVIELDGDYLINNILVFDENKLDECSKKGFNINEMDTKYPDIKTYVYMPTRIEEFLYIPSEYIANHGSQYRYNFVLQLNPEITYDVLKIDSIEKHKEYFYKSDFHWNNVGAYQGYADMINMINKDFNIGEPKTIIEQTCYKHEFLGNIASEIGQVGEADRICDYNLDGIAPYDYYINGEPANLNSKKLKYQENGNTSMYSDYDVYFGQNFFERRFDFNQKDKPNILVFCDSYFNVVQEWFASHFNQTVLIDMRANDGSFSLDYYVQEYDIDIILVSQMYKNLFFNGYTFIPLN